MMSETLHETKGDYRSGAISIGDSPIHGLTLKGVLPKSASTINQIAWSFDGALIASTSSDGKIYVWDSEKSQITSLLDGHVGEAFSLSWSPTERKLVTGGKGYLIRIWDADNKNQIDMLPETDNKIASVAWSPSGEKIALCGAKKVHVWDIKSRTLTHDLPHNSNYCSVAWSSDEQRLAFNFEDNQINILNTVNGTITTFSGHSSLIHDIVWIKDTRKIISASDDNTIRMWDTVTGDVTVFEGHTAEVTCITISHDSRVLASKSKDNKIIFWDLVNYQQLASIEELSTNGWGQKSLRFHPFLSKLAAISQNDTAVFIWDFDVNNIIKNADTVQSVRYTTAKIVLVGDSGVGKTGLGWRLAHNEFKEHSSTHGQQFWVVPELGVNRNDGTECEAVLWDLAGQHIYRSIHSIFLENVDASLILFDPSNRHDPLKGVQFWLEQLKGKRNLPPSVLVGARVDRGTSVLSQQDIDKFCEQYQISGGYISTSAKSGHGIDKLIELVQKQIKWDQMTTTVTTTTFKHIKEYVLSLKEKTDRNSVLVSPTELSQQLQVANTKWVFTENQMMTAVNHLQNHGYVSILKSSIGDEYILLTPDLLVSLASSIVLLADKHPRELGSVSETAFLRSEYSFEELRGLSTSEQQILLDAAILRFLEHSVCFRETLGSETLLIFPDLIKQKRPLEDDFEWVDDMSYIVRGRVENIYASLTVLLGYTSAFTRINQWQNQAQYELGQGEVCGFRVTSEREGELELVLYYCVTMPLYGRTLFQGLFESFLYKHDVAITRFPPIFCNKKHVLQRAAVIKRIRENKDFIFCDECGEKVPLPDFELTNVVSGESRAIKRREALAQLRNTYETYLVRIKGFRRDRVAPRCYVHYDNSNMFWSQQFIHDLRDAGVQISEKIDSASKIDFGLFINTFGYKDAKVEEAEALERKKIQEILQNKLGATIIQINLRRDYEFRDNQIFPAGDMSFESRYLLTLFDLVLNIYAIPFNHPAFETLRTYLLQKWNQFLAHLQNDEVYISYAWGGESEKIADELDKAFQSQGITIIRDKRDLGYKGHIRRFMERIGQGKAVIMIISEKYLKSENCMFELMQAAKSGELENRVFPVVLDDARIYKATDRVRYVEYWQGRLIELEKAIAKMQEEAALFAKENKIQEEDDLRKDFMPDIELFDEIKGNLPYLAEVLKNMNSLTPELHRQSGFKELINAVFAKLEE